MPVPTHMVSRSRGVLRAAFGTGSAARPRPRAFASADDAASSSLIRNEGTMTEPFILTMSCPTQRGIVSKLSTAIFRVNGDILEADKYEHSNTERYIMIVFFDLK